MKTSRTLKLLGLAPAACLAIAACGGGSDAAEPSTTATIAAASEDTPAMNAEDDMEMAEGEHEHGDAPDAIPWDGPETPTVRVAVTGDSASGWDISAEVTGFSFSNPAKTDHVAGEGHTHVYVDGQLVSMSYEPVVHVAELEAGEHQAMVTLSRNDHTDYSLDGRLIMAMTTFTVAGEVDAADTTISTFTVAGEVDAADTTISVLYMDGTVSGVEGRPTVSAGDTVEITVHSDTADLVHVHGYDLFLELDAGETDSVRFAADIPGIFEVEFEDSGVLLLEFRVS
jgi:hypothetical protein